MTHDEMDAVIDRHFRAEERADVEAAIGDLTVDVDHELAGGHQGHTKDEARTFYADLFEQLRLRRITSRKRLYGSDFAVDEATVDAETVRGEPAPFRLLHVFEFSDGRISRESAWKAPLG